MAFGQIGKKKISDELNWERELLMAGKFKRATSLLYDRIEAFLKQIEQIEQIE